MGPVCDLTGLAHAQEIPTVPTPAPPGIRQGLLSGMLQFHVLHLIYSLNGDFTGIPCYIRLGYGQILIETAIHFALVISIMRGHA